MWNHFISLLPHPLWRLLHHIGSRITFRAVPPFTPGTPSSTINKLKWEIKRKWAEHFYESFLRGIVICVISNKCLWTRKQGKTANNLGNIQETSKKKWVLCFSDFNNVTVEASISYQFLPGETVNCRYTGTLRCSCLCHRCLNDILRPWFETRQRLHCQSNCANLPSFPRFHQKRLKKIKTPSG